MSWKKYNTFQLLEPDVKWEKSPKVFIFDIDQCIIGYKNCFDPKRPYIGDCNNWLFLGNVVDFLLKIKQDEYKIVFVSNQSTMTSDKEALIYNLYCELNKEVLILCSTGKDEYRKPNIGFKNVICHYLLCSPDKAVYCGDACGENDPFPPYRWSSVDRDFSINLGNIEFVRPIDIFGSNYHSYIPEEQMVIMVGNQGSGKTTYAINLENHGYIRMSQDDIDGNLYKKVYLKYMEDALRNGKKIVLDATHGNKQYRELFVSLANKIGVSSVIIHCIRDGRPFAKCREKKLHPACHPTYTKFFTEPCETKVVRIF